MNGTVLYQEAYKTIDTGRWQTEEVLRRRVHSGLCILKRVQNQSLDFCRNVFIPISRRINLKRRKSCWRFVRTGTKWRSVSGTLFLIYIRWGWLPLFVILRMPNKKSRQGVGFSCIQGSAADTRPGVLGYQFAFT